MAPSHTDLEFIINHVILPRQLPPSQEQDRHALEDALLQFLRSTAEQYCTVCPAESLVHWKRILGTLTQWSAYLRHGLFSSSVLSSQIDAMQPSDLLALDFSGHNAALIIRRVEEGFVFEDFEPLADNKSVMACKGSLIRRFPSRSIIVSKTIMCDVDFRHELVNLICRLQEETFLSAQATVKKAGVKLHEPRELPSSELVSQLLMSIVAASGKAYETVQIKMRTRDTVEWRNAYLPWRRSSLWQVIKVTIRLSLALALGAEAGFNQYKSFMLVLNQSICRQAVETNQSPSTLHMIRAKMARRAAKMTESLLPNVKEMVHQTGMEACRNIEARWRVIQATNTAASAIEALPSFEDRDTYLFLRSSGTFLRQTIEVPLHALSECSFEPDERSRLTHGRAGLPTLPAQDRDHDHLLLVLLDFEEWVACKLDGWVASAKADQSLGRELCDLANRYLDLAGHSYLPSQFSPLLLTVLHVWKAADEMIVKLHPTLASHAPGIPASFLEPLVLPTLQQLEAVTGIESYLIRRRGAALNPCCTVFSQPDPTSVAIQIYDSSSRYRKEREKIEKHAQTEQELKEKAWIAGKAEYDRLREEANSMNCDEVKDSDDELVHSYRCRKCKIIEQADGMTIQVFEWPLPAEESMLKAVIFELLCPAEIKLWRDLTWRLLHDLGRKVKASSSATPFEYVRDYRGLVSDATGSEPRITLRSTTKSNYVTHYKDPKIHSAWSKVNLPHGLKYRMFDRQGATWLADQLAEPNVRYKTNTRLPDGPYKNIEATVNDTSHTSNWVVANQDKCSDLLSLDAFYAFGSLRAGESIQWLNILRVLASRELDLNDQAILILIQQTIWQMGTPHPSSGYRTSHARLDDPAFITSLLRLVEDCLARICENWKEEHSMDLMICLLLRVSELATDKKAIQEAIRLLNVARNTCFGWVKQLLEAKGHDADSEQSKSDEEMRFRVVRICLLCLGTFDLPAEHVQTAFARDSNGQSHSNTKFYVAAAIIVHDHRPRGDLHTLSPHWQRLLVRNNRVTHKAERYLRQAILQDRQGVDAAIQLMWEGFDSEESWECYQEPNARWVRARTIAPSSEKTQLVQYNLLSGKLLVDSHPLGRLPAEYRADSLFQRLLGNVSSVQSTDPDEAEAWK